VGLYISPLVHVLAHDWICPDSCSVGPLTLAEDIVFLEGLHARQGQMREMMKRNVCPAVVALDRERGAPSEGRWVAHVRW
jgi:hypothetical protein